MADRIEEHPEAEQYAGHLLPSGNRRASRGHTPPSAFAVKEDFDKLHLAVERQQLEMERLRDENAALKALSEERYRSILRRFPNSNQADNVEGHVHPGQAALTDEYIQDLVGAMFSGNTETGIAVTYQDSDGTIDAVVSHVDAVTLAADADTLLGISGQALSLDTQSANLVFAGPTSGGAADPTFRSLVQADLGTLLQPTIVLTAAAGKPWPAGSGCGKTDDQVLGGSFPVYASTLDFATGSDELAYWPPFVMPDNWNGGTLTARFHWTADSGSGTVCWAIYLRTYADGDPLDLTPTGVQTTTDTLTSAEDNHISSATAAITPAATTTPAGGHLMSVTVYRDVSEDTLGVDALLLAVHLEYTLV